MGNGFDFGILSDSLVHLCPLPAEHRLPTGRSRVIVPPRLMAEALGYGRTAQAAGAGCKEEGEADRGRGCAPDRLRRSRRLGSLGNVRSLHGTLEESTGAGISSVLAGSAEEKTFYLETFGCQMNDHDSEKVAGVLMARGYSQVEKPEAASVILYNTCSIREKAAQKVFSRLGEFRERQAEGK